MGVSRSERSRARSREGGSHDPVGSNGSASSPDITAGPRADPGIAALARSEASLQPARVTLPPAFEVRCADIHPGTCEQVLRAPRPDDLVALACEHGKLMHGFTAVWYSAERLAAIAAAVT